MMRFSHRFLNRITAEKSADLFLALYKGEAALLYYPLHRKGLKCHERTLGNHFALNWRIQHCQHSLGDLDTACLPCARAPCHEAVLAPAFPRKPHQRPAAKDHSLLPQGSFVCSDRHHHGRIARHQHRLPHGDHVGADFGRHARGRGYSRQRSRRACEA